MPRGEHPNSLKALEENRTKTQFRGERAVQAAKASGEARAIYKSLNEDLRERCTPERVKKMNDRIIAMAERGNLRAYELIRDGLGERPQNKVEISSKEDEMKKMDSILEQMGMIETDNGKG